MNDLQPLTRIKNTNGIALDHFDSADGSPLPLSSLKTFKVTIEHSWGGPRGAQYQELFEELPSFIHLHLTNPRIWRVQTLDIEFGIRISLSSPWLGQFDSNVWYDFEYPRHRDLGVLNPASSYRAFIVREAYEGFVNIDNLLADVNVFSALKQVNVRVYAMAQSSPRNMILSQYISSRIAADIGRVFRNLKERFEGGGGELTVRVNGWDEADHYEHSDAQYHGQASWIKR